MNRNQPAPAAQPTAAEVCERYEPGKQARALLDARLAPAAFFGRLCRAKLYSDAVRFAAHLLPPREAVWWGSLCAFEVYRPSPPPAQSAALRAAARWIREPTEENRRAAEAPAQEAGAADPAGAVAVAAFWSGGSMSRPGLPAVPPPPFLTARTVAGAILTAVASADPDKREERFRQFLRMAVGVSLGKNRWE